MSWVSAYTFGTKQDDIELLEEFRKQVPDSYFVPRTDYLDRPGYEIVLDPNAIEWLGRSRYGNQRDSLIFVFQNGVEPIIRAIPQKKGGIRHALDQGTNPNSLVFSPSALFGDALIIGEVMAVKDNEVSYGLYKTFCRILRKTRTKVGRAWLGREALDAFLSGARLTYSAKAPRFNDLMFPEQRIELLRSLLDTPEAKLLQFEKQIVELEAIAAKGNFIQRPK